MSQYELLTLAVAMVGIFFTVLIQALYFAYKIGRLEEKLTSLGQEVEKHNKVVERTFFCEASTKSAHKRLNDTEHHFKDLRKSLEDIKTYLMQRGQE